MEQFGLQRTGTEWVYPKSNAVTAVMMVCGGIFLFIGAAGFFQAGLGSKLLIIGLFGGVGLLLILGAVRGRQSIDLAQRAFVWQGALGRTILPFNHVVALRPIHVTSNGAYQGIHLEACVDADPQKRGRRISPSFQSEAQVRDFERALRQLMQQPA